MNFNKYSVRRKQAQLVSKGQRVERRAFITAFKLFLALFVLLIVVCAGAGFGMIKGILDDAPDINSISIKPKGFKTTIMSQDGAREVDSLSTINSNRIYVYYSEIPRQLVDAFVSIEDERFWEHNGIDIKGIFRAGVRLITTRNADQGASTITQQLIKNQVFNVGMNETTFMQRLTRKIQEQYLAIELEKKYTKEQILEYYLNTIYLGQGVNGVEAASKRYFNKSVGELNLSEMAVIAAITQNPYRYDPVNFPEYNAERREWVLYKMLELGYIDQKTLDATLKDKVYDRVQMVATVRKENSSYNSWFMDDLMREFVRDLMRLYGTTRAEAETEMYTGGYTIYSTQDDDIQKICDDTLNNPEYFPDKKSVALDYALTLLDPDGETTYNYGHGSLVSYNQRLTGNYDYNNIYPNEEMARAAADTYKEAMIEETGATFLAERFSVSQQPQISFTVMDPATGYIKAIVGGRGEKTGNLTWNRATMSTRQPGSTFKVLAAFGPYIDTGGCLATSFDDAPYKYINGIEVSNWYKGYRGVNSIRVAIMNSMNIIAVKTITDLTPEVAYQYLINEGFTTIVDQKTTSNGSVLSDINQSLALGGITDGVTNLEITAAYAAIANMGIYRKPVYYTQVFDHDGNMIIDNRDPDDPARTHRVFKETTAYQLIQAMRDVVTSGTGKTARMKTGVYNVGKTGTTSESYDLWFCGFTPYYAASIWYGYDSNVDNGNVSNHQAMWRDIMDQIAEREAHDPDLRFPKPDGLETVKLCSITNRLAGEECPACEDLCAKENVPRERCGGHEIIEICKETHHIATNTCPEKLKFAVQMKENGEKELVGAPFEYDQTIFVIPCELHPAEAETRTISTSCSAGGMISPSVDVEPDSTVTIYIAPNIGYVIGDVIVDGVSVGPVASYTFSMVTEPHTIHAEFVGNGITPTPPPDEPDPPVDPEQPENPENPEGE
ncbi:MAG: transglycosylase domain-containing protein [Eubacterium sp.]|nr:transglycosylase domain-containing protein [Eubacterium sp.]